MNHTESSIQLRKSNDLDAKQVHKLICLLENENLDLEMFTQMFSGNVRDPRNIYLVAEENGLIVGFISCHSQVLLHHLDIVYEIQEMFVDEHFRGKGLGRQLLENLQNEIQLRKGKYLEVSSNKLRDQAHEFYQLAGFNRTHYKFTKNLNA
ncbi:MAG TPA: GNAT family N-acetyltransferase [Bacteroidia bacterium]